MTSVSSSRPRCLRSLTSAAQAWSVLPQLSFRPCVEVAVLVPGLVEELHEADAALDEAAGEQAVVGERRLAGLGAVHRRASPSARCEMSISSGALDCMRKAISNELIRVAISGSPTASRRHLVERAERVERVALQLGVDAGRVGEVEDRVALAAERDALVDGGQEAAAPVGGAAARSPSAGAEDDEAGQVLRLAAQAVGRPGAQARPAELLRAGVHEDLRRRVVERVGDHRLDDRDVVDDLGEVRQQLGELGAALAVPGELELRARAASSSG